MKSTGLGGRGSSSSGQLSFWLLMGLVLPAGASGQVGDAPLGRVVSGTHADTHYLLAQSLPQPTIHAFSILLGDLDGNASIDAYQSSFAGSQVWINDGSGTLGLDPQDLGLALQQVAALGDIDGDNDLDVWQTRSDAPDVVWINQGGLQGGSAGDFADGGQLLEAGLGLALDFGDLDQDGDLDLLVVGQDPGDFARVWINQGGGQAGTPGVFLASGSAIASGSEPSGLALGDVDGDGDLDALIAEAAGGRLLLNDGLGGFEVSPTSLASDPASAVCLGDLDGDGDLDAYLLVDGAPDQVFLNQGGTQGGALGDFVAGVSVAGELTNACALTDADLDGDLDIFISATVAPHGRLLLNGGTATFVDTIELDQVDLSSTVATADLDGDGDDDVVFGGVKTLPNLVLLAVPQVEVSGPTEPAEEGLGTLEVTFTRALPTGGPVVDFVVSGSADFGLDYTVSGATTFDASAGSVTFAPGQTSLVLILTPLEDGIAEDPETIVLELIDPSDPTHVIGRQRRAEGLIAASTPVELMRFRID